MRRIFVTGTAGFIGYHLADLLLAEGFEVHGHDGVTEEQDAGLKRRRHERLLRHPNFTATEAMLDEEPALQEAAETFRPDAIVHLAAQAGVRSSLQRPHAYVHSNVMGTVHILELAKRVEPQHLLIASSSSVYGANERLPFREIDDSDRQLSVYGASKKSKELLAHSYAHLFGIPTTVMRFFNAYGPWARPDLALSRFVDAMLDDRPIDLYNSGEMVRDFTFVTDLARAIRLLLPVTPPAPNSGKAISTVDSVSSVAPFRIVNVGNSEPIRLSDLVSLVEEQLESRAKRNLLPMQPGDIEASWADIRLLQELTGYRPEVGIRDGVARFIAWFRDYYRK